jgi:hypothetical protein
MQIYPGYPQIDAGGSDGGFPRKCCPYPVYQGSLASENYPLEISFRLMLATSAKQRPLCRERASGKTPIRSWDG